MIELLVGGVVGLLLGWWFLDQPQWVKNLKAKIFGE